MTKLTGFNVVALGMTHVFAMCALFFINVPNDSKVGMYSFLLESVCALSLSAMLLVFAELVIHAGLYIFLERKERQSDVDKAVTNYCNTSSKIMEAEAVRGAEAHAIHMKLGTHLEEILRVEKEKCVNAIKPVGSLSCSDASVGQSDEEPCMNAEGKDAKVSHGEALDSDSTLSHARTCC
jgi:hypothetical protein